jgi:F-box-like
MHILPNELLSKVLSHVSDADILLSCALVSKRWHEVCMSNSVWLVRCQREWPLVKSNAPVRSFAAFFRRRKLALMSLEAGDEPKPIENCEWALKCPMVANGVLLVDSDKLYCGQCDRNVHIVHSQTELEYHTAQGNCVSFVCVENNEITIDMDQEVQASLRLGHACASPWPCAARRCQGQGCQTAVGRLL